MMLALRAVCMAVASVGLLLIVLEGRVRFDRAFLFGGMMLLVFAGIATIDLWPLARAGGLPLSVRVGWTQAQLALAPPAAFLAVRFHELLAGFRFVKLHWVFAGWSVVYVGVLFSGVMVTAADGAVHLTWVCAAALTMTAAYVLGGSVRALTAGNRLRDVSGRRTLALHLAALTTFALGAALEVLSGEGLADRGPPLALVLGSSALSLVLTYTFMRRFTHLVADRRRAHERLQQAYQELDRALPLRRLGQATAMVNQEIDSHVVAIDRKLDELTRMDDIPDDARELVANTREEVDRLRTLSRDVLELARTRVLRDKQPYAVAAAIDETLRGPLSRYREQIEVVCAQPELQVLGESDKLGLALANIARNAFEAGATRVRIAATSDERTARITVSDNGPGCEPERLPKLFEAFYTTKPDTGCGLGLAITKSVVDAHGGSVAVALDDGGEYGLGGLRFEIGLPRFVGQGGE
ncbi:MAG: hypothetical protein GF331_14355 [Chitinivibrionales bacterium]|nr:hypothetical protein [Chitinivibrionales bacterium]